MGRGRPTAAAGRRPRSAAGRTARAVRFTAPYRVELGEVAVPEPRQGEVLVRTEYSGISGGTEMLAYRGEVDRGLALDETLGALAGTFDYPFAYGYSCVGIVERSRSAGVPEGSRVFAFHPHQELFVVDAGDAVPVGELDARAATLFPLVETALQVCLDAGVRYGEHVAAVGLGPVGTLSAALLARSGASVVASDPQEARREAAREFGIEAVAPEELPSAVAKATDGRGADFLVEGSGNPAALAASLGLLAHEGVALVCSWYGTKPVALPLGGDFHRRRLELRSVQVSSVGGRAMRWDRARRRQVTSNLVRELPLGALASHDFPFERAAEAYAAIERADDTLVHAALRYP